MVASLDAGRLGRLLRELAGLLLLSLLLLAVAEELLDLFGLGGRLLAQPK